MAKKLFLLLILIVGCKSKKHTAIEIIDKEFKTCSNLKHQELINKFYSTEDKFIEKQDIHTLFENYLIEENYLVEINKKGYSELLNKAIRKEITPGLFNKFKTKIGFDPLELFPNSYQAGCYDYLITQLKIVDKSSWLYQFRDFYWKSESLGFLESNNNFIIEALNRIPDEQFEKIIFRKLFLNIIYRHIT